MKSPTENRLFFLLLAIAFPFFFFGGPGYYAARSFKAVWDLGHIMYFALATIGLYGLIGRRYFQKKPHIPFLLIFLLVLLLGLVIEFLQLQVNGRKPDLQDILRNQLGALSSLVFFCPIHSWLRPRVVITLQVATLFLIFFSLWPLGRALIDERVAVSQFPLLSDFETPFEADRWKVVRQLQIVDHPVRHGKHALRVQLTTQKYSGTALFYFPRNWSGYQWLNFSVYNPLDAELTLHSRMHDRLHKKFGLVFKDRFHKQFSLEPGWNDLRISLEAVRKEPAGREMDMQQIEGFGIFVIRQTRPLVIYLDHVYLSR